MHCYFLVALRRNNGSISLGFRDASLSFSAPGIGTRDVLAIVDGFDFQHEILH